MRHHVVHQVLADGLGTLIEQITLLSANFLHLRSHSLIFCLLFLSKFSFLNRQLFSLFFGTFSLLLLLDDHEVNFVKVGILVLTCMLTISTTLSNRLVVCNRLKTL